MSCGISSDLVVPRTDLNVNLDNFLLNDFLFSRKDMVYSAISTDRPKELNKLIIDIIMIDINLYYYMASNSSV